MLDTQTLENAKSAYAQKNYEEALRGYYDCIKQSSGQFDAGEAGLVYHMLGNCLIKMHNYKDASDAYSKALLDESYDSLTSVHSNYALALSSTGNYQEAIAQFEKVLLDPSYKTPYKTYNGMGNAYMQLGDFASAGTAFRNAAVDESNPQPVKSLLNLGVCFMGLNRPSDAVETYKAIFEFSPDQQTLNKTYANMGQAYVAMGQMTQARESFENAIKDGSYQLSEAASSDYMRSLTPKSADVYPLPDNSSTDYSSPSSTQSYQHDDSGIDVLNDDSLDSMSYDDLPADQKLVEDNKTSIQEEDTLGAGIPSADDTGFFTLPDEGPDDLQVLLDQTNAKPKRRGRKLLIVLIILLIIAIGGGVAFWLGYGFPTQTSTVQQLFKQHEAGEDTTSCWITTSNDDDKAKIAQTMNGVAKTSDISIDYTEQSMLSSEVIVSAKLAKGGTVRYDIKLSRDFKNPLDLVGWKISSIQLAPKSTSDSSSTTALGTATDQSNVSNSTTNSGSNSSTSGSQSQN